MNVEELRTAVRAQLDLDKEDLGDALLDQYLLEAFQQTTANELRWPWLETSWVVNATSDGSPALLPDNVGAVASVVSSEGEALEHVSHEDAENYFADSIGGDPSSAGSPSMYSMWGTGLHLWPGSKPDLTFTIRGWRMLREDWYGLSAGVPDCDSRLHSALVHYAISRAYAGQEDDVLSGMYLSTWRAMTAVTMTSIMRARYQGRITMGRGVSRHYGRRRVVTDFL